MVVDLVCSFVWDHRPHEKNNIENTQVTIYSYMNYDSNRRTAKLVENWLINNSKECDPMASY